MKNLISQFENIKSIKTLNTGGNCLVDVIELQDDRVVIISDEYVGFYKSLEDFLNCVEQINGFCI